MNSLIAIFLGGGLGALSRYGISTAVNSHTDRIWLGTLSVNVLGCALIFLFIKIFGYPKMTGPFVVTGFLGALTTFSTFSLEVQQLLAQGKWKEGSLVIFLNMFFGIIIGFAVLNKKILS